MLRFLRPTCRAVRRALWDYANKRLSEALLEKVEAHLPECPACRRELASLRRAQGLLAAYRREPLPEPRAGWNDLQDRLATQGLAQLEPGIALHAVVPMGRSESRRASGLSAWMPSVATACSFAAFLMATAIGYRMMSPAPRPERTAPNPTPRPANTAEAPKVENLFNPLAALTGAAFSTAGTAANEPPRMTAQQEPTEDAAPRVLSAVYSGPPRPRAAEKRNQRKVPPEKALPADGSAARRTPAEKPRQPERIANGLKFEKHAPTPDEAAPRNAPERRGSLLDPITPLRQNDNGMGRRFILSSLEPAAPGEDAAY